MATKDSPFLSFFKPGAELRDAALAYASIGLFVLPLVPHDKPPAVKHGLHAATTNTEQIKTWWKQQSIYNIGIALRPSCIVVIDIDPRNNGDGTWQLLIDQYGEPPSTYTVKTASGGLHYYYRVPVDFYDTASYPGKLGEGVDLLINKYVVAPPSELDGEAKYVIDSGDLEAEFELLPFKWLDRVVESLRKSRLSSLWSPESEDWSVDKGDRNNTLASIAGWARDKGASTEEIEAILRVFSHRFDDSDGEVESSIPTVAQSVSRYPPGNVPFAAMKLITRKVVTKPALDSTALYGPLGDYVKFIAPVTEAHPAAMLGQLLVAFGNIIGARDHYSVAPGFITEEAYHRTALYLCLVGDSARAGKGDSWSRIRKLVSTIDPSWTWKTGIHTGEALIDVLADDEPTGQHSTIQGSKVEHVKKGGQLDRRFLVYEPEFGRALHTGKRLGSTLIDIYRTLWDEGSTAKITAGSKQTVTNANVSLIGHITKAELHQDFGDTELQNGFGNRIMWIYTERTKILSDAPSIKPSELFRFAEPLREALTFAQDEAPEHYQFTKEASEYWDDLNQEFGRVRHSDKIVDSLTNRDRPITRRLAVIYAVADCSEVIDVEHLDAAISFWDYCSDSIQYIFGNRIGDKDTNKLYQKLQEETAGLNMTEILEGVFQRNKSAEHCKRMLQTLIESGLVVEHRTRRPGARKTVSVYMARPEIYD